MPCVLLHGWAFDHRIWLTFIENLKEKYTFYLVDLPGFGKTPLLDWEQFKTELLAALPQQFALCGWSLGGLYSCKLALEAPSRISHLLHITSSPYFLAELAWPGISESILNNFYEGLSHNPQKVYRDFMEIQKINLPPEQQGLFSKEGLAQGLVHLKCWDFRSQLHALNMPVGYIFGRLDAIVNYRTLNALQLTHPHFSYFSIKKAAHFPFLSHAIEVQNIIYSFLGAR